MKRWRLAVVGALVCLLAIALPPDLSGALPAQAQPAVTLRRVNPTAIAASLYQQFPELPLENAYAQRSGAIAQDDTLISRIIRYHLYVKDRPPNFRLDWKLTLADYLGAFQPMESRLYPSADTLSTNPMVGDQIALQALSRHRRNQLAQALFDAFTAPASSAPR